MRYGKFLSVLVLLLVSLECLGQNLLSKNISLEVNRQRLDNVLEILSNKGDFYFSYNSNIIKKDSLVTFNARNKTVKEILSLLFNTAYEFRESGNYIIIRRAPIRMTIVTNKAVTEERIYAVSGHVYDEQSGTAINEASVYEKRQLVSALTDPEGFFKLKLKSSKASTATLTISKEFYEDTSIVIQPRLSQELTITMMPVDREQDRVIISPEDYLLTDSVQEVKPIDTINTIVKRDSIKVERTGMGRFLLSAKQKVQSLNLKNSLPPVPSSSLLFPVWGHMAGWVDRSSTIFH